MSFSYLSFTRDYNGRIALAVIEAFVDGICVLVKTVSVFRQKKIKRKKEEKTKKIKKNYPQIKSSSHGTISVFSPALLGLNLDRFNLVKNNFEVM